MANEIELRALDADLAAARGNIRTRVIYEHLEQPQANPIIDEHNPLVKNAILLIFPRLRKKVQYR